MAGFVNVGAFVRDAKEGGGYGSWRRPASKAAVRKALEDDPKRVKFDGTSALPGTPGAGREYPGEKLLELLADGTTLVLAGPDPYRTRDFFGNVKFADTPKKGKHVKVV